MRPPPPFHPVVILPEDYVVLDLRQAETLSHPASLWTVGRYDEDRGIYTQELFAGRRTVHMGIDLGGPAGVAVHAFAPGFVLHAGINPAPGDYGHVLVTEHTIDGAPLWVLWGHLSAASLARSPVGRRFQPGEVLAWLGEPSENGGWPPHLHVQLSIERPATHDLPGAVAREDREEGLRLYPDPRRILGPLYR